MIIQLTDKEIKDIKQGLYITIKSSDDPRMTSFFDRLEAISNKLDNSDDLQEKRRSASDRVQTLLIKNLLAPNLDAEDVILIFDLIESNPDAKSRLQRLMDENCIRKLTQQEIEEVTELLNDYPSF